VDNGYNFDQKNPNASRDLEHLPPAELIETILGHERRIFELVREIKVMVGSSSSA
jgi:hypothetical protein